MDGRRLFNNVIPGALLTVVLTCPAVAAGTPVALSAVSPQLTALASCISARAAGSGQVVSADRLANGLEFRLILKADDGASSLLIISGLFKPDVAGLSGQDDDPEAHSAAVAHFFNLLRIPLGYRAWVWQKERETAICREAAEWIAHLRSRPVMFDGLSAEDEPR